MFHYYNNMLCVEAEVLYGALCLLTYDAYHKHIQRKTLFKVRNACPGQKALLSYDSLPIDYKEAIKNSFGDPYELAKRNLIEEAIKRDEQALKFFRTYTYNGNTLSPERQREYCTNAEVLNAIGILARDRKAFCAKLGGKAVKVWETLAATLLGLDKVRFPHTLPMNPRSLERAYNKYADDGYIALIHKNYGNDNTAKLNSDSKMWVLARWADQVNKVPSMEQLLVEYNATAAVKGWKLLKESDTLHDFLHSPAVKGIWYGHRYGELKAKEKYSYQIKTTMPTMRDSLWYSDGTKLNYFYLNAEGKVATISVYEVMDAYSEVLLGYHIAETENYATQYCAYKMAVQFSGHKPYQVGFDNQGGHKKLISGSFLDKIAHLCIKTQPYNGKSKTIESAFGRFQMEHLKKDWFFTGQNIQTKRIESKANMEVINANKANLPTLDEVKAIYLQRRTEWNNAPHHSTGKPRIQMYQESHNPETPKIELWDMVDIFWIKRAEPVAYNAYGLTIVEKKQKYTYSVYGEGNLPDMEWHHANIDKKFFIKFDPEDMSMIYLYDQTAAGEWRFVKEARIKVEVARGKQEQEDFDTQYIANILKMNKENRIQTVDKIDEILKEHGRHITDYGLNAPAIAGVNSKRKTKARNDIGKALKEESMTVPVISETEEDFNPYNLM